MEPDSLSKNREMSASVTSLQDTVSHLTVHSWKRSQSIDSGFVVDLDSIHENRPFAAYDALQCLPSQLSAHPELVIHGEDVLVDDCSSGATLSKLFSSMESVGASRICELSSRVTSLDSLDSSLSLGEHVSETPNAASGEPSLHVGDCRECLDATKRCEKSTACENKVPIPLPLKQTNTKQSWLLRLFESKLFDMSIAIQYLFNSKEPGVQAYIGNRMFTFDDEDVDFYLPQILNMYIYMHDVAEAVHPYLLHRCRTSIEFSIKTAWLIGAYAADVPKPNWKNSQGVKLKNMILSEELR